LPLEHPDTVYKRITRLAGHPTPPAYSGKSYKSKITNGVNRLPGIDGRNTWGRRFRDLIKLHLSDLGGESEASEAEKSLIRRVATLAVELELLEVRFATANTGAGVRDLDMYIRATGCLRRTLETLGLRRRAKDITPSVEKFIATYGEDDKADAEEAEIIDG
jgi:hypothetical protein